LYFIIKDDTFAFLSRHSSDTNTDTNTNTDNGDTSRHRIRESIRNAYHRVVDRKDNADESSSDRRIRQSISGAYHRVADKIISPKPKPITQAPYIPQPQPYDNNNNNRRNQYPDPYAYENNGGGTFTDKPGFRDRIKDKIKSGAGAAVLGILAKKIMGRGGGGGGGHYSGSHNYHNGNYNGYNYRPNQYGNVQGAVCTNYLEYDGIVYGQFRCPVEGYDLTATACCGMPKEQYCCHPSEVGYGGYGGYGGGGGGYNNNNGGYNNYNGGYNNNYNNRRGGNNSSYLVASFMPFLFIFMIALGIILFCVYKKRIYEKVRS
jgi:hypothetical protein